MTELQRQRIRALVMSETPMTRRLMGLVLFLVVIEIVEIILLVR